MVEKNVFGLASFGSDWLISEPVSPNVWLTLKVISNTDLVVATIVLVYSNVKRK